MKRLTKTYKDGSFGVADDLPCGENSYAFKELLINNLGEYEDMEEQGKIIKLPCTIGDTVYVLKDKVIKGTVCYITCDVLPLNTHYEIFVGFSDMDGLVFYGEDFGERLFHTEEEAENYLKNGKKKKRSEYHGRQRKHPKA